MFNKNSNKTLWIIFAILLVAVILIFSTESTKKERSFRKDLVSVDTSSVSSIVLYPKSKPGQQIKLLKDDEIWKVSSDESGKNYIVPEYKIKNLLGEIIKIKPKRVAARSKSKWSEYEVDSAATRVVVNESGSEVLNLVIGKFSFQQPRSMSTFVRLYDETDVYEVDGFLEMTFNKDVNNLRDETVIKSDKEKWNKLSFNYNDSGSFELIKIDSKWTIDGNPTDSAKTVMALNTLQRVTSTDYIDYSPNEMLSSQSSELIIELTDGESIQITGNKGDEKYVISSSLNKENYFDGNKIGEKIFITKESLF